MRNLLLTAALAVATIGLGCGQSGEDPLDDGVPIGPALTVEETAKVMLEALKDGDVDTFLAHADLRGIYERFPEPMRRTFTFEHFKAALEKAKRKVRDAKVNEFKELSYEILGVEERDGFQVVTFKTRSAPGKKWKTFEAYFSNFDGAWKITGKGVKRLSSK